MVKALFLIFLVVLASSIGTYWLHSNSGMLWFYFMDQKIETSVTVFSITIFLAFVALQLILWMLYKLFSLPAKLRHYLQEKGYKDSIRNLSTLLIAINDKDFKVITKLKNKFDTKYLSEDVLNYIKSLPEKSEIDDKEGLRARLIGMINSPKTKLSALKQLVSLSEQEQQFEEMYKFSEQLWKLEKSESNAKSFLNAMIMTERWSIIDKSLDKISLNIFSKDLNSFLSKHSKTQALAFAKLKLADQLKHHADDAGALKLLIQVLKLNSSLHYAIIIACKILIKNKDYNKAVSLIKNVWKNEPTCTLTNELFKLSEFYRPEKFLTIARKIHGLKPYHYESHILLAKAALEADQFDEASDQISEALARDKNQRACILMAEFCERTHGNKTEILTWLKSSIITNKEDCSHIQWDALNLRIANH